MINADKVNKYDKNHRIVLYKTDKDGKCIPEETIPEIASELVDTLYQTRSETWIKFKQELIEGKISPLRLFVEYYNMNVKDLASRVRLSPSKVKKHLEPNGFKKVTVEELQRYAIVFDMSVGDFFQYIHIADESNASVKVYDENLIQDITIKSK